MDNMKYYDMNKEVPVDAQKPIGAGRTKNMTNINCQWRLEKLTEMFGAVGFGWYTKTIKQEIIEGGNGEKKAFVDILLFVSIDGKWSEGIEGHGGSNFVAKETNGYYTSDECFKMAKSDAISVACKSIGIGANIYRGIDDSKYSQYQPNTNTNNANTKANSNTSNANTDNTDAEILKKIKNILYIAAGKDKDKTIELLEKHTSFEGKDKKIVPGVKDFAKLSSGRLKATYGKLTKEYPDIVAQLKASKAS